MLIYVMLLMCTIAYSMEDGNVTKTGILTRMHQVRANGDSPLPWVNRKELQLLRKQVDSYCTEQHTSHTEALPTLIDAARQTRLDREGRESAIAPFSRVKIAAGSIFALLSLTQIAILITSWAEDDCDAAYDRLFNGLGAISSGLGGGYMIYDGLTNTEAKLESLEACKTELLLLEKYVVLQRGQADDYDATKSDYTKE